MMTTMGNVDILDQSTAQIATLTKMTITTRAESTSRAQQ